MRCQWSNSRDECLPLISESVSGVSYLVCKPNIAACLGRFGGFLCNVLVEEY